MEKEQIFIIGAGSMAEAFIRGVTRGHAVPANQIWVKNRRSEESIQRLVEIYGIHRASSFASAQDCDMVVLAVKPNDVPIALNQMAPFLNGQPILSFAAGVSITQLETYAKYRSPAVRTMPNLPVSVSAGSTAVSFSDQVNTEKQEWILSLLRHLGHVAEIPEHMMDAVTAFSGSGPGFICYFLEAMEEAAATLGFQPQKAREMLLQTLVGTVRTLQEWGLSPKDLRNRVTSPGGTTFAGTQVLDEAKVKDAIVEAIEAARQRSVALGSLLNGQ